MTVGQGAYEAYVRAAGGKSLVSGAPLPAWDSLPVAIRHAWDVASQQVRVADGTVAKADLPPHVAQHIED